ncbi:hypothetical protein [Bradyrhizobium archetypum]|uniref:hypothetical protein n=1 Tax=Bradyrhizobium archetypum TaxID=2721160 RepID=UPI001492FD51|nr:hypothetical protein [Bradyrhizobium archetypum]
MYRPSGVKTLPEFPIPDRMRAWVLGDPDQLLLQENQYPLEFGDVGPERGDRAHILVARCEIPVEGQTTLNSGRRS